MKIFEVKTEVYNGLTYPILSIEESDKPVNEEGMVYDLATQGKNHDFLWVAADDVCFMDVGENGKRMEEYQERFNELTAQVYRMFCKQNDLLFYIEVQDSSSDRINELKAAGYRLNLFAPAGGELNK